MQRYYYMDNLRAGAMLLGVVFHAALAHSAIVHHLWPSADTQTSRLIDFFAWFSHSFRMPLFFFIGGFFASLLLEKYGLRGFIYNRLRRLVVPFAIFWPLVSVLTLLVLWVAATQLAVNSSALLAMRAIIEQPGAGGEQPRILTTGHLWFLYYLCFFCGIAALVQYLCRGLLPRLKGYRWLASWPALVFLWPLLTCACLMFKHIPHPPPSRFQPAFWALGFYGGFFFVGWSFYHRQSLLDKLKKYWVYLLVACVLAYSLYFYLLPTEIPLAQVLSYSRDVPAFTLSHFIAVLCSAILAWYMCFLCLLAAQKFFNTEHPRVSFIAEAAYWIYLIHLPLIFAMQSLLHLVTWPILLELTITVSVTLALGLASYACWVKPSKLSAYLGTRALRPPIGALDKGA